MRTFLSIILTILLLNLSSCKSQQKTTEGKIVLKADSTKTTAKRLFLFKNKKLEVFEVNGSLTYKLEPNENTNVIQFSYEKDMDKVTYDGGYREEVVFEVPGNTTEKNYTDAELQNTKMLFGRYCFCRGQTGLYKVNQGKLHLTPKKEIHFDLQFKVNEVPQVTTEVSF